MIWNSIEYKMKLNFSSVLKNVEKKNKGHTKRQILKITAMTYDPIDHRNPGFLAPLQEIWTSGNEWDEILPIEILTKLDS